MDSHIGLLKLVSLSAHGFILKPWVTVIGRCEGRADMGGYLHPHIELKTLRVYVYDSYRHINEEMDFHTIKIRRAFRYSVLFLKDFWEPTSVSVKVVLLVEDDTMGKHLYLYIESRTLRVYTCM